jgi:hypothetical protein
MQSGFRAKLAETVNTSGPAMKRFGATLLLFGLPLIAAPCAGMADIALTGQAAMGLGFEQGKTTAVSDLQLSLRAARVTDGGIEFGAVVDVPQRNRRAFRTGPPRAVLYMSTGDFVGSVGR